MQKKTFPDFVPPMMAQSAKEPFDSPDWIFEMKPDGYRAITVFDAAGKPRPWSHNGLTLEQRFPAISKAVSRLNGDDEPQSLPFDGGLGSPCFSIQAFSALFG
jgi:bifunctional non-homologous end joining protein LigD